MANTTAIQINVRDSISVQVRIQKKNFDNKKIWKKFPPKNGMKMIRFPRISIQMLNCKMFDFNQKKIA